MSVTAEDPVAQRPGGAAWLWRRQLSAYPDTGPRVSTWPSPCWPRSRCTTSCTSAASVSTLLLVNLHMSFTFFVVILAFGNLIGAFGSLFAGLADRLGRANLVVFGLLLTGIFTAFVLPAATSKWSFGIDSFVVGAGRGHLPGRHPGADPRLLPAGGPGHRHGLLDRRPGAGQPDRRGRSAAHTIPAVVHDPRIWTHEYRICGIAGLVVFVIALVGLRELSPQLRDQLMVTMRDRALIEARAKGIDVEAALRHPFRQLLKPDIIVSAIGVSMMLLIYYTAVGVRPDLPVHRVRLLRRRTPTACSTGSGASTSSR